MVPHLNQIFSTYCMNHFIPVLSSLQRRQNEHDGGSHRQPHGCLLVYSGTNERKHQSSASLAFVREIHRWPVNSPHKGPVTRKMFLFDDVIMMKDWQDTVESAIYSWVTDIPNLCYSFCHFGIAYTMLAFVGIITFGIEFSVCDVTLQCLYDIVVFRYISWTVEKE